MSSIAKALFASMHPAVSWKSKAKGPLAIQRPFFEKLYTQQRLSPLDYLFTTSLLRGYPQVGDEVAVAISCLLIAARKGHLCVKVDGEQVTPCIEEVWRQEGEEPLSENELKQLTQMVVAGMAALPLPLLTIIEDVEAADIPATPFCRYRDLFYLQRYWVAESRVLKCLSRHSRSLPTPHLDTTYLQAAINKLKLHGKLLDEQAQAILQACMHPLSIIIGGPGTGKTYTAGHLIQVFWEGLTSEQQRRCEIALAAPTGKAAAHLKKSLAKVLGEQQKSINLTAKTLHALLGIRSSRHTAAPQADVFLTADLILVDESSMIDVEMMARLLAAVKPGARLVLLGDPHQLPSVEAGNVLAELVDSQKVACTELKTCLRAELKEIVDFAAIVKQGDASGALSLIKQVKNGPVSLYDLPENDREGKSAFLTRLMSLFPSIVDETLALEELLHLFDRARLLTALRKGPFGVEALNTLLWGHFSKQLRRGSLLAVPIMVTINDYKADLFNGEGGVLLLKHPLDGTPHPDDYALFPAREGSGFRKIPALMLPRYERAYCLSVHKSQGSEFDHVLLVMPEGGESFGRELFYTAVTRARKCIEIFGAPTTIAAAISQKSQRQSGLASRE